VTIGEIGSMSKMQKVMNNSSHSQIL